MYNMAIDVHNIRLVCCVRDGACRIVARGTFRSDALKDLKAFVARWQPLRVALEASGSSPWLVDLLGPLCQEVVLAHPARLRVIAETVKKTDKVDAATLSELLVHDYIPRAWIATADVRESRALVRTAFYLSREVRRAKQRVRAVLQRHNIRPGDSLWTRKGREGLREWCAASAGAGQASEVLCALALLEAAEAQRRALDKQIEARVAASDDALRVRTIPGVGSLGALALLSALGDWKRFRAIRKAVAYLGLSPRLSQSGETCHLGHITRQGDGYTRSLLVEGAWWAVRKDKHLKEVFERIAARRGKKRAIVAVARHLLMAALSMLRAKSVFGAPGTMVETLAA